MFQALFCQSAHRVDHLGDVVAKATFNTLEECHVFADDMFDLHKWGGFAIVHNGKIISTRSRAKWLYEPRAAFVAMI